MRFISGTLFGDNEDDIVIAPTYEDSGPIPISLIIVVFLIVASIVTVVVLWKLIKFEGFSSLNHYI
jgi:hypothetical protein